MTLDKKILLDTFRDYMLITLGLLGYAFGWVWFLLPYEIVSGGVTGISAIVFYATKIPISFTYFVVNAVLLVIALKILGWRFLLKTIYAIVVLSLLLEIFQKMTTLPDGTVYQLMGEGQDFMSMTIGSAINGISLGIVFLNNGSTGGTDIVAAVVNKYYRMSLGRVLLMCDFVIIGSCLFIFGDNAPRMVAYGFVVMVIENFVLDYFMNSRRESVQFLIFSQKYQEIAQAIARTTDHGVTLLDGHGWYTGREVKVICVLARKRESVTIFRQIKRIDPNAFVSQSSVIGVYGEGFDAIKVNVKDIEK